MLFGYLSDRVFTGPDGLAYTFLICLVSLVLAGAGALVAARTYPHDVAAVLASRR
ncbi:hypothetical protein [Amycolatopsis rhizosphaerae]|uniref:hypothetical protein n=1 Tax=Amycolatopsis rhizosphaerae TaxID=2053003 RepID=UPI001643BBDE|nr:hypothetical protein [Amycolatopsis rhizosphaerae]